jgi:aminocarboxymuconate-semialdehyde decarboxylase
MTFDVHAHHMPPEMMDLLRVEGRNLDVEVAKNDRGEELIVLGGRLEVGPLPAALGDRAARLAAMDAAGVQTQLLSHRTELSAYGLRGDAGPRYSRAFNRVMADEVARDPDRFLALGTVPLQNPAAAAEELRYAVQELGMVGVEIASMVDGVPLDQAGLDPFWDVANQLRCFVLLHPNAPLPGVDLRGYFMENMFGRPAESTLAIGRLLFSGVLERYPDLVLCLVHGGGFLPYQLGRFSKGYEVVPHLTATKISRPPAEFARRLYYDSLLHVPEAVAFLVALVGAERVVVGSDYPYEMHERQPVAAIEAVPGLTEEQRSLILRGNVERILGDIRR